MRQLPSRLRETCRTGLPGLASFLQLILALEGTMNFPRRSFRGSAASREAAYSRVAAPAGKTGLEGLTGLAPLAMPLEGAMVTGRGDPRERRRRCIYLSVQGCCLVCVAVSQRSVRIWPGPLPAPLPPQLRPDINWRCGGRGGNRRYVSPGKTGRRSRPLLPARDTVRTGISSIKLASTAARAPD